MKKDLRAPDGLELKKDGDIILIPQLANSPNDPCNWSAARTYWIMAVVLFATAFTAATSNDAEPAQDDMNEFLGIPWTVFNTGTACYSSALDTGLFCIPPVLSCMVAE